MKYLLAGLTLGLAHLGAAAAGPAFTGITIEQPYARATLAGQSNGAAYFTLNNHGADDRLLTVKAAVATQVELHHMSMDNGVMRMRQLEAIDVPAGTSVKLKPGSLHLMLVGLKAPLKTGAAFPMTLTFEKAGEMTIQVAVQGAGG